VLPAIEASDVVQDTLDQGHGIDLACREGFLVGWIAAQVALVIDLLGKDPNAVNVGEDDVPVARELRSREAVPVSGLARNVQIGDHRYI
jgi:hypothetical protein